MAGPPLRALQGMLCLTLLITGNASAQAQQTPKIPQPFAGIYARVEASADLRAWHAVCPADLFKIAVPDRPESARLVPIGEEACSADPEGCVARCLDERSPEACLASAAMLDGKLSSSRRHYVELLLVYACASGSAQGCAKRAYGILNGEYENDPFNRGSEVEIDICVLRTSDLACADGSPTGCTMLGQAYQWSDGVEADVSAARRAYERTCAIAPDSSDCEVAEGALGALMDDDESHQPSRTESTPGAEATDWSMQIASQPSHEAAQAVYQDLSRRYASVLNGRSANIVKVEIPAKGAFWRVYVPAGTLAEATNLCASYQDSGGNCLVLR